ncbi:MAG: exopolysaccharide Pel transporter PelG [Proteobacteria bacterium]|nr:exopolysaccharide Pel transporter PelG [Pseudomonadota bacterium]
MAGIGFQLRRLSRQDNLMGTFQAYIYSALISTGPWIFTIIALGGISMFAGQFASREILGEFRRIVIYNFAFSLVMSAPVFMVVTRYLADSIYREDVSDTPGLLLGSMALLFGLEMPVVCVFYLCYSEIETVLALCAIANFLLISGIWLVSIFITALKNYKAIIQAFALGMTITVAASVLLSERYGAVGIVGSFNLGLSSVTALLIARILVEYPYPFKKPFAFLSYFGKYWEIALSGLVYNLAVWSDKWVMWFAPEADRSSGKLILYPNYDSAMFLAYLTIVPAMAMFVMSVETDFFERYRRFYRDIQEQATFRQIQENQVQMIGSVVHASRGFLVLQGSICFVAILLSSRIFDFLGINYLQLGMFRFGVLGSLFQVFTLFLTILLSYFDNRRGVLLTHVLFLVTNGLFTLLFLKLGFRYYGYGFFLASLVTFAVAAFMTMKYIGNLVYHTFITSNTSVM